jgi:hypothetical protein
VGVDRLRLGACGLVVLVAAACGSGGRTQHLLDGGPTREFPPVPGSVIAQGRVVPRELLGGRLGGCRDVPAGAVVVDRIGVVGQSLTFANADGTGVSACDGGIDPAGERQPPWCGSVFGELARGRLLDPRLDVLCRTPEGEPLAYAFVEPVAGAAWIGVRQDRYTELYEVLAGLPVRIASTRDVSPAQARASFEVTQFDAAGHELLTAELRAAVAG